MMQSIDPAPGGHRVLTLAAAAVGLATALWAAMTIPLGPSEASGLAWLASAAEPDTGWGEPFRHGIARTWGEDQPALTFVAAAIALKLVPSLGALLALRLPDILAAAVVTGGLVRLGASRAAGVLAVLIFVASPVLWAATVGPPGLIVDAAAVTLLYAAVRSAHARPGAAVLIAGSLAIAALIGNGAGVYVIAVVAGIYLHIGLVRGEWRLFGNIRLTVLAWLLLAGLTLVGVLGLPDVARWIAGYRELAVAVERSGLRLPAWILAAIAIVPSLAATAQAILRPAGEPGRLVLVLAIGALVLSMAATTPFLAVVALAPAAALWWATPLAVEGRTSTRCIAALYVSACLAGVAALLVIGRAEPATAVAPAWASMIVAIVFSLASLVVLWRAWRGGDTVPAAAVGLALAALIAAGMLWLAAPQQLLPQRSYDRELAADLVPLASRSIAVLAPVDAALWRAELGRPVFFAPDVSGLCRWAAQRKADQAPLALARPGATDSILNRFDDARPLLQSPGAARTSVMVVELGSHISRGCRAGG